MTPRRRQVGRLLVAALVVTVILVSLPIAITPGLRVRLTEALGERFGSDVELASLRVSLLPRLRVSSDGVVLRHKGRTDVPPLITIASFSAEASLRGLLGRPLRLSRVRVEGLEINVPPGGIDGEDEDPQRQPQTDTRRDEPPEDRAAEPAASPLVVDDLIAERAVLRILRRHPDKEPRVWEIAELSMQGTGSNEPWPFRARLTNPIPPGRLAVQGTFGPWHAEQPSSTPLGATYEFEDADLAMFKGIHGVLHSTGEFDGVMKRIAVEGTTSVPEFGLDGVDQPVPLTTNFSAVVDGTNGNVWLQPVRAQLGQSSLVADGGIVEPEGEDGRTVRLDVVMSEGRVEDVLRLVVKGEPAVAGGLQLKAKLLFPPGDVEAIEKLQLDGSFGIASARFSEGGLQAKMNELSQKARGEADSNEPPDRVATDFAGRFTMKGGVIRFSTLTFAVPGAKLDLAGTYAVRSEALDFRGTVRMEAKLSELTTGFKSFLLKAVDPLVRRKGVTVIPITVSGTAAKPDFGLDVKRAFSAK